MVTPMWVKAVDNFIKKFFTHFAWSGSADVTSDMNLWTAAFDDGMIVTSPTFPPLTAIRTTNDTNVSRGALRVVHQTTGNAADNLGVAIYFGLADNGVLVSADKHLGAIFAERSGADDTGNITISPSSANTVGANLGLKVYSDYTVRVPKDLIVGQLQDGTVDNQTSEWWSSAGPVVRFNRTTADTAVAKNVTAMEAKSTGNIADDFGPQILFTVTDTGITRSELGYVRFVRAGGDTTGRFEVVPKNAGTAEVDLAVGVAYTFSGNGLIVDPNITPADVSTDWVTTGNIWQGTRGAGGAGTWSRSAITSATTYFTNTGGGGQVANTARIEVVIVDGAGGTAAGLANELPTTSTSYGTGNIAVDVGVDASGRIYCVRTSGTENYNITLRAMWV